jgi:hypothetical protein
MKIGKLRPKKFYNIGPVRNDEKNVFLMVTAECLGARELPRCF